MKSQKVKIIEGRLFRGGLDYELGILEFGQIVRELVKVGGCKLSIVAVVKSGEINPPFIASP